MDIQIRAALLSSGAMSAYLAVSIIAFVAGAALLLSAFFAAGSYSGYAAAALAPICAAAGVNLMVALVRAASRGARRNDRH
jgi:hypothetical protein